MSEIEPQRLSDDDLAEEQHAIELAESRERRSGSPSRNEQERSLVHGDRVNEDDRALTATSRKLLLAAFLVLVLLLIVVAIVGVAAGRSSSDSGPTVEEVQVSAADIIKCVHEQGAKYNPTWEGHGRDPSAGGRTSKKGNFWIKNATVWVGDKAGTFMSATDVLVVNGAISVVGTAADAAAAANGITLEGTIDANGAVLTPGIVDMHSHIGVYSFPQIWATADGNEMTNPTFPQVRAIDAIDPEDWAIPQILAGGVTTSQVLPGSGNLMGGEGAIVKLRGKTVREMFVQNSSRLLKFACGENPKRVYGRRRHETPMSRMGSAWLFRKKFDEARTLKEAQDNWCNNYLLSRPLETRTYPHDLSLEGLASVLRGEAKIHNHCYQIHDLEMMMRVSDEFEFRVSAFHHALEAYKIPQRIAERNITIATFTDLWGYKFEAYDASVHAPRILDEAGVNVALKSDHPVIFAATLMWEATKANYYGLSKASSIAALTSVPAAAIGMDQWVGEIKVGRDGDLVLWDRYPLSIGSKANKVLLNGVLEVDKDLPMEPPTEPAAPATMSLMNGMNCPEDATTDDGEWAVTGVDIYPMTTKTTRIQNGIIVVRAGNVTCIGTVADCPEGAPRRTIVMSGGSVMPGLIDAGSGIGQLEIDAESSTQDGSIEGSSPTGSASVHAMDGIRISSRHVRAAWAGGITTSVARPQGTQVVAGESVAFHTCHLETCGQSVQDQLIQRTVALHLNVGNSAKDTGLSASISGELDELREVFVQAREIVAAGTPITSSNFDMGPFVAALRHEIPVVAEVYQADVIASVALLQADFNFTLVILGGTEAHVVRQLLADAVPPIGVIQWARMPPMSDFDNLRVVDNSLSLLADVGIPVGLFVGDPDNGRNLRWEAGWAHSYGLDYADALASITTNVADMLMIKDPHVSRITVGSTANFVVYDGDPLEMSHPRVVAVRNGIQCNPQQF